VARGFAAAESACTRHDLGVEHSLHSTLNTYLEKLLSLVTGNFGRRGGNNLHTQLVPLIGHSLDPEAGGATTRVTGMREISKFFPPNILPAEIDSDHPERIRALVVDSSNPMQTAADTGAYQRAFEKLELLVAIDVADTETVRLAHYVLPAPSQYEKWEATFFTLSFPTNYFHLRRPIVKPSGDTLPEPEIYRRLMVAMGDLPARFPVLEPIARLDRRIPELGLFPRALTVALALRPGLKKVAGMVLYATLGRALARADGGAAAAAIWGSCQFYVRRYAKQVRRTGHPAVDGSEGTALGEALFQAILTGDTAVPISTHTYEEMWELVRHPDGKVHLDVPEMLEELAELQSESAGQHLSADFPFVLASGERRSYNANQIYRDPEWRRQDRDGALRIHPEDAERLGLAAGQLAVCESRTGSVEVVIKPDDSVRPGCFSLPHGYGQTVADSEGDSRGATTPDGPRINMLTSSDHCDPIAKTPYHKYVPVRLRPVTTGGLRRT
jgi:anaerobic selenocysteine-containing dehydrogenase